MVDESAPVVTQEEVEKELKEAFKFGFDLGETIEAAGSDGKYDASDLGLLVKPLMSLPAALDGIQLCAKFGVLSAEKKMGLVEWAKNDFDLVDDKLEEKIEAVFEMLVRIYGVVELFKK